MAENNMGHETIGADLESRRETSLPMGQVELSGERFSIAESLRETFAEIDENGMMPEAYYELPKPTKELRADQEVFREVLRETFKALGENSYVREARKTAKQEGIEALDKYDRRHLIDAYHKARDLAFKKVKMSPDQLNKLSFETRSELNRGLETSILTGAAPESWAILFASPKRDKLVNWLSAKDIVKYMRNAMTTKHPDVIKAEIRTIREEAAVNTENEELQKAAKEIES